MYIGHILEIRAQGNYEISNSILWKWVLSRLQVAVERPPVLEVAKPPQRRRARNLHAKEAKWAPLPAPDQVEPPESEAIFSVGFSVGRFGPTPAWARRSWRQPYRRWTVKNKIVGGWIKCYNVLHDFSTTPRDPQVVNGMSIAELIYWKLRAWGTILQQKFSFAGFRSDSYWGGCCNGLPFRTLQGQGLITKGFAVKVMEGTLFYAKESVLYFKIMI